MSSQINASLWHAEKIFLYLEGVQRSNYCSGGQMKFSWGEGVRQCQRMDNSERDRETCLMKEYTERWKLMETKDVQSEWERERDWMGWMTAVELIVILIDEVIPGTIPKLECPREVFTRSSKSQSASEKDDIAFNFSLFCFCWCLLMGVLHLIQGIMQTRQESGRREREMGWGQDASWIWTCVPLSTTDITMFRLSMCITNCTTAPTSMHFDAKM